MVRTISWILFLAVWVTGIASAQTRPVPTRAVTPRVQPTSFADSKKTDKKSKEVTGGTAVIPMGDGGDLGFDPKNLGQPDLKTTVTPLAGENTGDVKLSPADEIISFKSNNLAEAKCIKQPLTKKLNIDFEEAPLDGLVKWISCLLGKNFIVPTGVGKGKTITIMSPKQVTVYEAYRAFLAALEINGLTIVPSGKYLKIMDVSKAKQDTLPIYGPDAKVPNQERFVTRLVELEHIQAAEIESTLAKFKTANGDIFTFGPTNTLVITDTGANIKRLLKLIQELDQPTGKERIWLRPIEYAEAKDLVSVLEEVFLKDGKSVSPSAAARSARAKGKNKRTSSVPITLGGKDSTSVSVSAILADERTNQLIIKANRSSYLKLDRLIRKLDVPIPGEGQIHIHYLENADADEISQTLSSLTSSSGSSRKGSGKSRGKGGKNKGGKSGGAALFSGEVKISPHEETNSLVIEASLKDYLNLKQVIEKLDIRRKQVYVEAVIMEITSTRERDLGITGTGGTIFDIDGEDIPLLLGLGGVDLLGAATDLTTPGSGLIGGLIGPTVEGDLGASGLPIPTFSLLIKAMSSNSDVNILSTPHILTTDNEEAEIQVGKQVPYRTNGLGGGGLGGLASGLGGGLASGLTSGLGGLGGLGALGGLGGFGSVQYIDVDLTLKFTPHINSSNFVRLEIEQELEDIEGARKENEPPTTSRRRVNNTVVVKDGQPVVIGGLIRDVESEGINKVPFLGDIPLIGQIFRQRKTNMEKKNLLMIIIPTIINDPSDLKELHRRRIEEMRDFADALATKKREYMGEVDYRKKSGAIEQMFKVVDKARTERELIENTILDGSELDYIGPPETHDIEYDPYDAQKTGSGVQPTRVIAPSSPETESSDTETNEDEDGMDGSPAPEDAEEPEEEDLEE